MIHSLEQPAIVSIYSEQRRASVNIVLWFLALFGLTSVTALFMFYVKPIPLPLGGIFALGIVIVFWYWPYYGLYTVIMFSLLGDALLWPWYPFVKNLSSPESILYISNALIFSPAELCMSLVLAIWLVKSAARRKFHLYQGLFFWPLLTFTFFLAGGLIYGLGTGGNTNIALWEVRPIFYIPLMAVLVSNLMHRPDQILFAVYLAMAALFVEGLIGSYHYIVKLQMNLAGIEAITEHSAAVHMNTLFIFVLACWLYRTPGIQKWALLFTIPPILVTYLVTQRRAAFLSLGVALLLMTIILYRENRAVFWRIVPIAGLCGITYLALFWNSGGMLGLPARAVKSVVAPDTNSADALSNIYRVIENINVNFTIHMAPLTGVGFGQKFYILMPTPDISFFIWWEYIVHNSVLWIWMKIGVFGFIALLFLISFGVMSGLHILQRMTDPRLRAVALTATLYLIMHFMYAYVDMSWDNQSMIYIGMVIGILDSLNRISYEAAQQQRAGVSLVTDKDTVYV